MLTIYEEDVNIETENPGVLEVPEGKKVEDLPIKHFVALADKKGLSTITRALNNLQVWNKNKNKPLSKWAGDMIDKVTKRFENQKKNESLIREFSSNFNGTEFGEVEFYSDDLYKWKNEDSIINAIEAHSPIDINVYGVEFEPSHNLVITYEVRAEDYDEDRIEAIVIDSLERLEDKIRDAKPKYLENIHSYDYAEKDTIANNISEWVFDGDVDTNLEELESLVGDLDFEAYADPDTLHDFLMSFTLDVLLYVESELNV